MKNRIKTTAETNENIHTLLTTKTYNYLVLKAEK